MHDSRNDGERYTGEMAAFERYTQTETKTTGRAACDAEVAHGSPLFYGTRGTSPPGLAFIYSVANERWPGKGPQRVNGCKPVKSRRGNKFNHADFAAFERDPPRALR